MASDYQKLEEEILTEIRVRLKADQKSAATLDNKLKEELGFDSLDGVEMTMKIEETYNIDIIDKDSEKFSTGRDIVNYIAEKKGYEKI